MHKNGQSKGKKPARLRLDPSIEGSGADGLWSYPFQEHESAEY